MIFFSAILTQWDFKLKKYESVLGTDHAEYSLSGYLHCWACMGTITIPFQVANGPLIQYNGFLLNSFLTFLRCCRTHLHIAVEHNTAYNISIISCNVLEIPPIPGLVFHSSWVMFFKLPHPSFVIIVVTNFMSKE